MRQSKSDRTRWVHSIMFSARRCMLKTSAKYTWKKLPGSKGRASTRRSSLRSTVSLLPLTPETRGLCDASWFARLKPGAALVNCGRGEQVVVADLLDALRSGRLRGAVLDVFEHEPLPADDRLTSDGMLIGTIPYMSPEHVSGNSDAIGPACDIYSLGVILYELATGERPFDAPSSAQLLQEITAGDAPGLPASIPTLRRQAALALRSVVARCLEPSAAHRYPDAGALAGELRALLSGKPVQGQPLHRTAIAAVRRHRRPLTAAMIATTLSAGGLMLALRDQGLLARAQTALSLTRQLVQAAEDPARMPVGMDLEGLVQELIGLCRDDELGTSGERAQTLSTVGERHRRHRPDRR